MDWLTVREFLLDSIKFVIVTFILIFLMVYVVSVTQVVGSSMSPTLKNQEILILNKAKYRFFNVNRGDIISFYYEDTKYLIKRVIGIPGDSIYFKDNVLYINNKIYQEPYLKGVVTEDFNLNELGYGRIPNGKYFVLGDNRENSLDSRKIGLIDRKDIIGEVMFRFWPVNKMKLF